FDGVWSIIELGQAMFNLGEDDGTAGGAYSCGRCHTKGWTYGQPEGEGGGRLGPNPPGPSTWRQFPAFADHVAFVTEGSKFGTAYGTGGMGSGQMPSLGFNPNRDGGGGKLHHT